MAKNDEDRVSYCKFCDEPVKWIRTAKNNKAMPLDPEPILLEDLKPGSNFFDEDGNCWVKGQRGAPSEGYLSHFASCEGDRPPRKDKEAPPAKSKPEAPATPKGTQDQAAQGAFSDDDIPF